MLQDASSTRKKCRLITLCIDGDDAGLTIHAEHSSVSGINTERNGHEHSRGTASNSNGTYFLADSLAHTRKACDH